MITVYTMVYNEERVIAHFVEHYRSRFPGCTILVHDNASTDRTADIARSMGCEVVAYDSGGEVNDSLLSRWKNNVWKSAATRWVLVCDADELLEIDAEKLADEERLGTTMILSEAWNMVSDCDWQSPRLVTRGVRDSFYDKTLLFNKDEIQDTGYDHGAHHVWPVGSVRYSERRYKLWHMNTMDEARAVVRQRYTAARMSAENRRLGLSGQYMSGDGAVHARYRHARAVAVQARVVSDEARAVVTLGDLGAMRSRGEVWEMLSRMRATAMCEVGVKDGANFLSMLAPCLKRAVAIDMWRETGSRSENDDSDAQPALDAKHASMVALSQRDPRVQVLRERSPDVAGAFADGEFDLVYIDADHTEAAVYADLLAWWPKVRSGGVLAGHDYCRTTLSCGVTFGVVEAVNRFCAERGLTVLVADEQPWPSWFLLKS